MTQEAIDQQLKELKGLMLEAPDGHIDKSAMDTINEWDDVPKAIQVLKTLDMCVHSGLTSGFATWVLESILNICIEQEKTTYEEVVKGASWRL